MRKEEKNEQILPDLEIIRRCSEGDARAQELLYRRYFSFAMSLAVRYTCDEGDAMETVNDSFMKVLEKISEFDTTRSFKSWYGKIVVNSSIDRYRRNVKHASNIPLADIGATEMIEPEIVSQLSAADIISLLGQLPENYRITFNLFEIEGYSHDEIAQMLGITESGSRSNLSRARKILRELYIKNFTPAKAANEAI